MADMLEIIVPNSDAKTLRHLKWESRLDKGKCTLCSSNKSDGVF